MGTRLTIPSGKRFGTSPILWSPILLFPEAWYDASISETITESGGAVSQWDDKSGNSRDIAQSTPTNQPSFSTDTISFNGTTDYLWNSSPFMYDNGEIDVYIVGAIAEANSARIIAEANTTDNDPIYAPAQTGQPSFSEISQMSMFLRNDNGGASDRRILLPPLSPVGAFDDTKKLYEWRDATTVVSGRVNGGSATTDNYTRDGVVTLNTFAVGALLRATPSVFADADINEIIITSNLSDADREKIEGYLAHKWGLTASLPALHPYKTTPPYM